MALSREDLVEACEYGVRKGRLSEDGQEDLLRVFDAGQMEPVWQGLRALSRKSLCGYPVLREVGEGASSRVFKALDRKRDRLVALKILRRRVGLDPVQKARFRREARMLSRLSHPNIVRVRAHGKREGKYYIVLDWVSGIDLHTKIERDGPLDQEAIIQAGLQACRALECAHRLGLIHRDVKPQNLLACPDDTLFLTDFGVARPDEPDNQLTRDGELLGTPEYISPEQAIGGEVDQRSDIYSLGATLYFLACGRPPFQGISPFHVVAQHQHQNPSDPREHNEQLSEGLATCILKCLEKDPAQRFASASDLLTALGKLMVGESLDLQPSWREPEHVAPRRRPKRRPAPASRKPLPVALWIGAGVLVLVAAILLSSWW